MSKMMILRGVSGSGKSTWIRSGSAVGDSYRSMFSADHHFINGCGEYVFDPSKLGEAHGACLRGVVTALVNRLHENTIIVDNTNTTVAEVAPYAALALAYGRELEIVTLLCDPHVAHARNQHGVSLEGVLAQDRRLRETVGKLPPWWPETVVER